MNPSFNNLLFISKNGKRNPFRIFIFPFTSAGNIITKKAIHKILNISINEKKNSKFRKWYTEHLAKSPDLSSCNYFPTISILVPIYNTPVVYLKEMIESVIQQDYPNWELCLADDCSTSIETVSHLKSIKDHRIKVIFRTKNGHISEASNSALELATGEYCALLDHDDLLPSYALSHMVFHLNQHPRPDFLYSDECKINEQGELEEPSFKPCWSPESLLSRNYPGHLAVFSTSLLKNIGGFEKGLEGSQDYDVYLKMTENANHIVHVPEILYYWRKHALSVAANSNSKPYAYVAAEKAISNALLRRGISAEMVALEKDMLGYYQVNFQTNDTPVSLIVDVQEVENAKRCVQSILSCTAYSDFSIVLINFPSPENFNSERVTYFQTQKEVWSDRINDTLQVINGNAAIIIDEQLVFDDPKWLQKLNGQWNQPGIGMIDAKLMYPNGQLYSAGTAWTQDGVKPLFQDEIEFLHNKLANTINNYPLVSELLVTLKPNRFFLPGLERINAVVNEAMQQQQEGFRHVYRPDIRIQVYGEVPISSVSKAILQKWEQKRVEWLRHSNFLQVEMIS